MSFKLKLIVFIVSVNGLVCLSGGNLTDEAAKSNAVSNSTKNLNGTVTAPQGNVAIKEVNLTTTAIPVTLNVTTQVTTIPVTLNVTTSTTLPPTNETSVKTTITPPITSKSTTPAATTLSSSRNEAAENLIQPTATTTQAPKIFDPRAYLDTYVAPIDIQRNFPYYHAGYDLDNRPIWVIEGGKWNVRSIVEQGEEAMAEFEKFALQGFYRAEQSINASSTEEIPVTEEVMIVDFEGLSLLQIAHLPTVKFLLHLAQEIRYFLLKHLHVALVVNTNAVAHTLINLVRPIFARAFEHIEIFGTNKDKWIPHVLRYCPRDQIPSWYGGAPNFKPIKVYG